MAALATMVLVRSFSVETSGLLDPLRPDGQIRHAARSLRHDGEVQRVRLNVSPDGMHELSSSGKSRSTPCVRYGPPSGPLALRVSTSRQGVSG